MDKYIYLMQEVCFVGGLFLDIISYIQSCVEVLLDEKQEKKPGAQNYTS